MQAEYALTSNLVQLKDEIPRGLGDDGFVNGQRTMAKAKTEPLRTGT